MSAAVAAAALLAALPLSAASCGAFPNQTQYSVAVADRDPAGGPLISHWVSNATSSFSFNFAATWFPAVGGGDGLVVRVVECNPNHHSCANYSHANWGNAGALAVITADLSPPELSAAFVRESDVAWAGSAPPPPGDTTTWGAADPRIVYRPANNMYYLAWDNCTENCYPQRRTLLSTTPNPLDPAAWTLHGFVFPFPYSSGASLLFRDDAPGAKHLAFVGNSDTAAQILVAESDDGLSWTKPGGSNDVFMAGRPGCWDASGVAPGPQPERLSTGDYFYVYNIDTGFPYHPNPLGRCSIGWAILDGDDPTKVVARAEAALLTPVLPWETCAAAGKGYTCQEPMVVFSTGMKPLGNDTFLVIFGAADTDVGVATIKVGVA